MRSLRHEVLHFGSFPDPPTCFVCSRTTARIAYLDETVQMKLALCDGCWQLASRAGLIRADAVISFEHAALARGAFQPRPRPRIGSKRRK